MAKRSIRVTGQRAIIINYRGAMRGLRRNVRRGLFAAGELVKEASEDLTSIDTSFLIKSTFNEPGGSKAKPFQVIGYEAEYAATVHEMPDTTNWQRPGAENEFLEKAVLRNISAIINAIRRFASQRPI